MQQTILHYIRVHATPDEVFERITTAEGLASWWTTKVEAEARESGKVRLTFEGDFNPVMRITRFDRGEHLSWRCVDGHGNWTESRFHFELEGVEVEEGQEPEETHVVFRQRFARTLDDHNFGRYNFNWAHYLASLKEACETGKGTPFKPPKK